MATRGTAQIYEVSRLDVTVIKGWIRFDFDGDSKNRTEIVQAEALVRGGTHEAARKITCAACTRFLVDQGYTIVHPGEGES